MASIRARLTLWYTGVLVVVLVVAAIAVAVVQERLALQRLDDDLRRSLLTLEGVMRTELDEGLDLPAASGEARAEAVVPDRTLFIAREDGTILATWGLPIERTWKPPLEGASGASGASALPVTVTAGSHPELDVLAAAFLVAVDGPTIVIDSRYSNSPRSGRSSASRPVLAGISTPVMGECDGWPAYTPAGSSST